MTSVRALRMLCVTSNLTPEWATERAFERAWVIWPLCAYRRRGRRIDPGAAIRSADRTSTDSPSHGRIRRYFRRAGQAAIPLPGEPGSPEFLSASLERQGFCRWRRCGDGGPHGGGAPHFAMGGPHRGGPHQPRCASERGLAMGGGRPAERRFTVGGGAKSVALRSHGCSRTGSSNPSPSSEESTNFRFLFAPRALRRIELTTARDASISAISTSRSCKHHWNVTGVHTGYGSSTAVHSRRRLSSSAAAGLLIEHQRQVPLRKAGRRR